MAEDAEEVGSESPTTAEDTDTAAEATGDATEDATVAVPEPGEVAPPSGFEHALAEQMAAESFLVRAGVFGIVAGVLICAVIWTGLMFLALQMADTGIDDGPALLASAVVGVLAGAFYGGWAAVMFANQALEKAEADAEAEEHAHAHAH
jgi:hypothetical protein